jgi:hypothetical protein
MGKSENSRVIAGHLNRGPSSATFEHAKAITKFIQRFGQRVN